jgi:hypothetical protein
MSANTMANTNVMGTMMKVGPLLGLTGGMAALAAIPNAEAKLFTSAMMLAVAVGGAMRKYLFAAPVIVAQEPDDYPFNTQTANPWERDGGPARL